VDALIEPPAINNEDEGFGRNAGERRHYYRIAIPLTELWSCCFPRAGPAQRTSAATPSQISTHGRNSCHDAGAASQAFGLRTAKF